MSFVELKSIDLSFGRLQVLHGIDLSIVEGEFLTLLGPSGSGKSTILRLIGGFLRPDRGQVMLRGAEITRLPVNRRPFNTVFQDYALFPHMTVADNIAYGPRVQGRYNAVARSVIADVITTVGLAGLEARMPAALSGGQRQRVALARAIVCQPELILLDEPLSALDAELRHQMQEFLKDLQRRLGITFVFVTHDQSEAIVLSDRIVVLNGGQIEQIGTPREVYYRPAREFVAGFFGDNNILPGQILQQEPDHALVQTPVGRILCTGPSPSAGSEVKVAIRPEALRPVNGAHQGARIEATIQRVTFVGAMSRVVLALDDGRTTLRWRTTILPGGQQPSPGDRVTLGWSTEDAVVIAAS
jgi:spermidine/putrescine transport system ATP-binding protein